MLSGAAGSTVSRISRIQRYRPTYTIYGNQSQLEQSSGGTIKISGSGRGEKVDIGEANSALPHNNDIVRPYTLYMYIEQVIKAFDSSLPDIDSESLQDNTTTINTFARILMTLVSLEVLQIYSGSGAGEINGMPDLRHVWSCRFPKLISFSVGNTIAMDANFINFINSHSTLTHLAVHCEWVDFFHFSSFPLPPIALSSLKTFHGPEALLCYILTCPSLLTSISVEWETGCTTSANAFISLAASPSKATCRSLVCRGADPTHLLHNISSFYPDVTSLAIHPPQRVPSQTVTVRPLFLLLLQISYSSNASRCHYLG